MERYKTYLDVLYTNGNTCHNRSDDIMEEKNINVRFHPTAEACGISRSQRVKIENKDKNRVTISVSIDKIILEEFTMRVKNRSGWIEEAMDKYNKEKRSEDMRVCSAPNSTGEKCQGRASENAWKVWNLICPGCKHDHKVLDYRQKLEG
jgi:hypothetical protein